MTARQLIKEFEGFKSKPYICPAGKPTIGYGTTIYPNGRKVSLFDPPISEEKATEMLDFKINEIRKDILKILNVELTENQIIVLTSFIYNFGLTRFKGSTLLKVIKVDPNSDRVATELRKWNKITVKGVKKVSKGLVRRREKEIEIYYKTKADGE